MTERRPPTLDHLLSRKKPVTRTVWVCLDPELAERHEELRKARDVAALRAGARADDSDAQARLWEAEAALERAQAELDEGDVMVSFTFRSIGRAAYDALVNAHPPTPAQRAQAKSLGQDTNINLETFPPALVAACLVEPKLSVDEAQALWRDDNWNQAELTKLFNGAFAVNSTSPSGDLGKDSRRTQLSGRS